MTLKYRLTHEDLIKATDAFLDPVNSKVIARLVAWSNQAIIFIIVFAWSLFEDGTTLHPIYWMIRFLFLSCIYFVFIHPVYLRRSPKRRWLFDKFQLWPGDENERTVAISEEGLEFENDGVHLHFALNYIQDVKKVEGYVFIKAFSSFRTIIPSRAFNSESQIDLACELLRSKIPKTYTYSELKKGTGRIEDSK